MAKKSSQLSLDLEHVLPAGELKELSKLLSAGRSELARREKIKRTHRELRRRGVKFGGAMPPYGKRVGADGKTLEDDSVEQAVIAFVVALRRQRETYPRIVELCNAQGFRNRVGKPFSKSLVVLICERDAPDVKIPRGRRPKSKPPQEAA